MEKAQRAYLLRQRFKANGGFAYVPLGKPKPYRYTISGRPIYMAWPEIIPDTKRAPTWMRQPDAKPTLTPRVKHNTGPSAVTKIAEKAAPKKLVRIFKTAETLLAARARR